MDDRYQDVFSLRPSGSEDDQTWNVTFIIVGLTVFAFCFIFATTLHSTSATLWCFALCGGKSGMLAGAGFCVRHACGVWRVRHFEAWRGVVISRISPLFIYIALFISLLFLFEDKGTSKAARALRMRFKNKRHAWLAWRRREAAAHF